MILLFLMNLAFACQEGYHNECVLPTPWGCKAEICAPNFGHVPTLGETVQAKANDIANEGHSKLLFSSHDGCMLFVTGGLAAWGGSVGGPIGVACGGTMGFGASIIACNQWYPE